MRKTKLKELREKSEQIFAKTNFEDSQIIEDAKKIFEELKIHQIELELQNEELNQTNKKLAQTYEQYQSLYEEAPIGYFTLTRTGNIVKLNKEAARILGKPQSSFLNTSFMGFLENDFKRIFYQHFKKAYSSYTAQSCELRLINAAEKTFWLKLNSQVYFDVEFQQKLCRTTTTDITEQKTNEEIQQTIAANPIYGIIIIQQKEVKFINNRAIEITGYSKEELGQRFTEQLKLIHIADKGKVIDNVKKLKQNNKIHKFEEVRFLHNNGTYIWLMIFAQKIDYFGQQAILHTFIDITAQKEIENKHVALLGIIENTNNIAVVRDLNLKIIATNKAFADAVGHKTVDELIGKDCREVLKDTPNERFLENYIENEKKIQKLPKGEKIVRKEAMVFPNKKRHFLLTTKFPVYDLNNKLIATASISTDITEIENASRQIETQNKKLTKLNATKDRFFSIIAHDLTSPFTSLLGFSEMLHEQYKKLSEEKRRKYITYLYTSTQNIYNLLESLLLWSRIQRDKIEINPEIIYMNILVDEIVVLYEPTAQKKNIKLAFEVTENKEITADKFVLHTILRNLVSNAIKFTNQGGTVLIKSTSPGEISVEDNGIGMPEDIVSKLFEVDKTTSTTGTAQEKGTGLGLILCKELIERHGGKISVESKKGIGSIFTIKLFN